VHLRGLELLNLHGIKVRNGLFTRRIGWDHSDEGHGDEDRP
jgi:hypothetical protein